MSLYTFTSPPVLLHSSSLSSFSSSNKMIPIESLDDDSPLTDEMKKKFPGVVTTTDYPIPLSIAKQGFVEVPLMWKIPIPAVKQMDLIGAVLNAMDKSEIDKENPDPLPVTQLKIGKDVPFECYNFLTMSTMHCCEHSGCNPSQKKDHLFEFAYGCRLPRQIYKLANQLCHKNIIQHIPCMIRLFIRLYLTNEYTQSSKALIDEFRGVPMGNFVAQTLWLVWEDKNFRTGLERTVKLHHYILEEEEDRIKVPVPMTVVTSVEGKELNLVYPMGPHLRFVVLNVLRDPYYELFLDIYIQKIHEFLFQPDKSEYTSGHTSPLSNHPSSSIQNGFSYMSSVLGMSRPSSSSLSSSTTDFYRSSRDYFLVGNADRNTQSSAYQNGINGYDKSASLYQPASLIFSMNVVHALCEPFLQYEDVYKTDEIARNLFRKATLQVQTWIDPFHPKFPSMIDIPSTNAAKLYWSGSSLYETMRVNQSIIKGTPLRCDHLHKKTCECISSVTVFVLYAMKNKVQVKNKLIILMKDYLKDHFKQIRLPRDERKVFVVESDEFEDPSSTLKQPCLYFYRYNDPIPLKFKFIELDELQLMLSVAFTHQSFIFDTQTKSLGGTRMAWHDFERNKTTFQVFPPTHALFVGNATNTTVTIYEPILIRIYKAFRRKFNLEHHLLALLADRSIITTELIDTFIYMEGFKYSATALQSNVSLQRSMYPQSHMHEMLIYWMLMKKHDIQKLRLFEIMIDFTQEKTPSSKRKRSTENPSSSSQPVESLDSEIIADLDKTPSLEKKNLQALSDHVLKKRKEEEDKTDQLPDPELDDDEYLDYLEYTKGVKVT